MKKEGIKVKGHKGTWYVIDEMKAYNETLYLLEHEQYGDEVAAVIVTAEGKLLMEDVWNGFDDLDYY